SDVEGEGVVVEGTVETEGSVAAVAYSLDGGNSWQLANGTSEWWFAVPAAVNAEYEVVVVAWTIDGVIGRKYKLGEIIHTNHSYELELRKNYAEMWAAFEQQNSREFMSYIHRDFEFYDNWEKQTLDYTEFKKMIEERFKESTSLRVSHNVERVMADMYGGELQGQFTTKMNRQEGDFNPESFMASDGIYEYERLPDGEFKVLTMKDWDDQEYLGFEIPLYHDMDQLDGWDPNWFWVEANDPYHPPYKGQLVFVLNYNHAMEASLGEPTVFVLDGSHGDPAFDAEINPVLEGGLFPTGKSNFSDISSIPYAGSGNYKSRVGLIKNEIYALNLELNPDYYPENDDQELRPVTALFKVIDFKTDGGGSIIEVRLRVILSEIPAGNEPQLSFKGVDLF
ncbi:MAG: hypothetical protein ACLFN5_00980, partial [bacterium]